MPARPVGLARRGERSLVPGNGADVRHAGRGLTVIGATIQTPHVDWLAVSPELALLAAAGLALLSAVLVPAWCRHIVSAVVVAAGFVTAGVFAAVVFDRTPQPVGLIADTMTRDQWGAFAQVIVAAVGVVAV